MRQEPAMASGLSTAVSRTRGRLTPKAGTHSAVMPSWKPASPVRKRAASTTARARVARLASSATSRADCSRDAGTRATSTAPTRGANRVAVSSTAAAPGRGGSWPEHQEGDDQHGAPEDPEGVAADQAGLEAAAAAGGVADQLGHAVDGAVDAALVDVAGQEGGERAAQVDGEELVDLVDVELLGQGPPGPGVAAAQGHPVDPAAVQQPGAGGAGRGHDGGRRRQPERGRQRLVLLGGAQH